MNQNILNTKIGILGGGQLGRMLCLSGANWNLDISVLDLVDCPASGFCTTFVAGDINDYNCVLNFGRTVDVLTIEIEHVNVEALFQLEKEGVKVFPKPAILSMINDKHSQKQFYKDNDISTSDFRYFENKTKLLDSLGLVLDSEGTPSQVEDDDLKSKDDDLEFKYENLKAYDDVLKAEDDAWGFSEGDNTDNNNFSTEKNLLKAKLAFPFVQKACKGGYDGKGVQVIKSSKDLDNLLNCECIVEPMVDIDKELAVIVARNESGEIKVYPTTEMEFDPKTNLVKFLFTPANINQDTEQKCQEVALKIVNKLDYVGLLAVELFLTKDGKILVNEIAPRTHNSGHHTIEGSDTSQFEQQLRAILNLSLGSTKFDKYAGMVNLVGEEGYEGKVKVIGLQECLEIDEFYLHLYDKKTIKPNRKMGHATILGDNFDEIKQEADTIIKNLKIISE